MLYETLPALLIPLPEDIRRMAPCVLAHRVAAGAGLKREDAEALIREAVKKAQSDAQALIEAAEAKQKELVNQKSEETKKAVEELKKAAAPKSAEAVKAILAIASGED